MSGAIVHVVGSAQLIERVAALAVSTGGRVYLDRDEEGLPRAVEHAPVGSEPDRPDDELEETVSMVLDLVEEHSENLARIQRSEAAFEAAAKAGVIRASRQQEHLEALQRDRDTALHRLRRKLGLALASAS